MNIYKISQTVNNDYDTFDAAVVAAENEDEAKGILPTKGGFAKAWAVKAWAPKKYVQCELIGTAREGIKKGVIVASYNAC